MLKRPPTPQNPFFNLQLNREQRIPKAPGSLVMHGKCGARIEAVPGLGTHEGPEGLGRVRTEGTFNKVKPSTSQVPEKHLPGSGLGV